MMKQTEGIFTFFFLETEKSNQGFNRFMANKSFVLLSLVRDFVFSECTSVFVFLVRFSISNVTSETKLDRLLHLKLPSSNSR